VTFFVRFDRDVKEDFFRTVKSMVEPLGIWERQLPKRTLSLYLIILLLAEVLFSVFVIRLVKAGTITVPDDYATIQEAINHANAGDTIYVKKGTYFENIIVNRTVSLLGESNAETILDGLGSRICVNVQANNVTMSGFTVRNCSYNAVGIWDYHNATLASNILTDNNIGVFIANGQNITVANNTLTDDMCGVMCAGSCRFNIISHNLLTCCAHSIDVHAVIGHNAIDDNLIQSSSGIGIWISNAPNTRVFKNSVIGSGEENILVQYCPGSEIYANQIADGKWGIRTGYSENKSFYHNNFINNTVQVESFANGTAIWDEGWEGNYWSDFNGTDSDHDGIGDTPYVIDSNNIDHYPLMNPYWIPADVNHDLKVNILDVTKITGCYKTAPSDPEWNPHADIAEPYGVIDILDVVLCTSHYSEKRVH
jgi:nitrous oxidase accessory protein